MVHKTISASHKATFVFYDTTVVPIAVDTVFFSRVPRNVKFCVERINFVIIVIMSYDIHE